MINEVLLMASIVVLYGAVVFIYKVFDKEGLFAWMALATVIANIEVLRVVDAFGIEQTLGNVLFASTFLATQILNENEGQKTARKAAWLGITAGLAFAVISQSWLLYEPSGSDWAGDAFDTIFSITPRIVGVSVIVYAICQHLDVWLFARIRKLTEKRYGDSGKHLWFRNNVATLITQIVNTVLYNLGAFAGIYSWHTLLSICVGSYLVFIVTSLCDTPALYLCRRLKNGNRSEFRV